VCNGFGHNRTLMLDVRVLSLDVDDMIPLEITDDMDNVHKTYNTGALLSAN